MAGDGIIASRELRPPSLEEAPLGVGVDELERALVRGARLFDRSSRRSSSARVECR